MLEAVTKIQAPPPARAVASERPEPASRTDPAAEAREPAREAESGAREALEQALRRADADSLGPGYRLSIDRDKATGTFVYRSVDRETGEVKRQWPAEELLKFREYLRGVEGLFVDTRA